MRNGNCRSIKTNYSSIQIHEYSWIRGHFIFNLYFSFYILFKQLILINFFSGFYETIYFDMGHKNPKIVLNNYDFLCRKRMPDKTMWRCTHYFRSDCCKIKLITFGRVVIISGNHNHAPSFKGNINHLKSQRVIIKKHPQKWKLFRQYKISS